MTRLVAVFYNRTAANELNEEHIVDVGRSARPMSRAAFTRAAREYAKARGWRLVEVYEEEVA